jgi:outer membrane protein OmpA-like peptidoglycan-associated protein
MTPAVSKTVAKRPLRAALVLLAIAAPMLITPGAAQERGSWWTRPSPPRDEPIRVPSGFAEREAANLYADARTDLDAERYREGQRKLELLVARHPMSALAEVARRDLQRLYTMTTPSAGPTETAPSMTAPRTITVAPAAIQSQSLGSLAAPSSPVTQAPVAQGASPRGSAVRLANEDFRQQAGDRVFFADGSTDLGARAKIALEAQATWLIRHPDVRIIVEGHADDQGARDVNRQLSEKRAEVVKMRLNDLGVPDDRMRVAALGRNEPVADCPEQSCKVQNRRVVTVIVQVPSNLGFDEPARRSLGAAAGAVGQPPRAP